MQAPPVSASPALHEVLRSGGVAVLWAAVPGSVGHARQRCRALADSLARDCGAASLFMSRSATTGLALVALCRVARLGVDVERDVSPSDNTALHALSLHHEEDGTEIERSGGGFLGLWTRKEAALKALGAGLAIDPRLVRVGPAHPHWQPVGVEVDPVSPLMVRSLSVVPGFHVALAALRPVGPVRPDCTSALEVHCFQA